MNIAKKHKKFIRANYKNLSLAEIAKETSLSKNEIEKYLKKLGKLNSNDSSKKNFRPTCFSDFFVFTTTKYKSFLLIALLISAVYINSLGGDFISDDISGYINNPQVHSFAEAVKSGRIIRTTLALNYRAFGANEVPLHIQSVLHHIVIVWLVFILTAMLFNNKTAVFTALLYALHPINTETVSWLSGRLYMFVALFTLLTLILYVTYIYSKDKKHLALATLVYIAGLVLVRRSVYLVTPFLLLVIDQTILNKRINFKSAFKTWPILVSSLGFGVLYLAQAYKQRVNSLSSFYNLGTPEGTPSIFVRSAYTTYSAIKLVVFPKDLTLYHEGEIISKTVFYTMIAVTAIFLITLVISFFKKRILFGLLAFFIFGFIYAYSPVQVSWFIAERYLYIPTIAFCILLALLFIKTEKWFEIDYLALYLLVPVLFLYSVRTMVRNTDWATRQSLWESTQRVSPNSPRVYNNLGDIYKNPQDSIKMFQIAIQLDPNYADAYHNLGNAYLKLDDLDNAKKNLEKAYELNPSMYQALYKLGVIEFRRENLVNAQDYFAKALEINSTDTQIKQAYDIVTQALQTQP